MNNAKEPITLGADVGGKDAHMATQEHILAFRKLLQQECRREYSKKIKEFALILRVDGAVQSWGKSGVEGVAIKKKNTFATADIFMPKESWYLMCALDIRKFLAGGVKSAIQDIIDCAKFNGVPLSGEELKNDVDCAIEKFIKSLV